LLIFKSHLNTVLLSHFIVLELTRYLKIQWTNDMITMNQVHKGTFPYAISTLKTYAVQNITYLLLLLHQNYYDLTNQSTHLLPCGWNLLPMCDWYSELNWTSNKSLRDKIQLSIVNTISQKSRTLNSFFEKWIKLKI
jgi:hypothetical protein